MRKTYVLILLICFLFFVFGCSGKPDQNQDHFNFDTKIATEMNDDGWVYFLSFDKAHVDNETFLMFGAYNIKHKYIDGYKIPVRDEHGNIIDYWESNLPYLELNPEIKPELEQVNAFLHEQPELTPKKVEDLDSLDLKHLDKARIVELYNQMISSDYLPDGKYYYLKEAEILLEESKDNYQWQVGYFNAHGVIQQIHIDLIMEGQQQLSDLVEKNEADSDQKAIYQKVKEIEKSIISTQSFTTLKFNGQTGKYSFDRLFNILELLEKPEV